MTICPLLPLWHGGIGPLPSRIPPYIGQNVRYGGIIPYITQIKILGKKLPFFSPFIMGV